MELCVGGSIKSGLFTVQMSRIFVLSMPLEFLWWPRVFMCYYFWCSLTICEVMKYHKSNGSPREERGVISKSKEFHSGGDIKRMSSRSSSIQFHFCSTVEWINWTPKSIDWILYTTVHSSVAQWTKEWSMVNRKLIELWRIRREWNAE